MEPRKRIFRVQGYVSRPYAENDEWEPLEGIRKVEKLIRDAGREVDFHFYPQVKHWLFEENRPEFDAAAAALAWNRTTKFLHAKLG